MIERASTQPPYYAVIFTSLRVADDGVDYGRMAVEMEDLAKQQPGYLGIESARGVDGLGITVSYWQSLDAIRDWRQNLEHRVAQDRGRNEWYQSFRVRICRVEAAYGFDREEGRPGQRSAPATI